MLRRVSGAPGIEFVATSGFASKEVRISTAETCRANRLMSIYHYLFIGSFCNHSVIVIYHPLAVMHFSARDNTTHITCFYSGITISFHKVESLVDMAFVIRSSAGRFVVHNHLNTTLSGILIHFIHIEIGIRSNKIKNVFFPITCPIFPTDVPAFNKHAIETVFSGKIDISLSIFCISRVAAIRF